VGFGSGCDSSICHQKSLHSGLHGVGTQEQRLSGKVDKEWLHFDHLCPLPSSVYILLIGKLQLLLDAVLDYLPNPSEVINYAFDNSKYV